MGDTKAIDVPLRDPNIVMRLARLGSFHQSRLSFMRILTRRMAAENWRFERRAFEIDTQGVGYAIFCAHTPDRTYSLVAFAHDLPAEKRSDRVIAEAWDATFTLFDGAPSEADVERLSKNVPLQEAGRITASELTLARANRSVRLWEHVVSALSKGDQPDTEMIEAVGYLMRTTAVYGSGKFGAADREVTSDRPEFNAPFQVEMLTVYLIRWFVLELVQHMANAQANAHGQSAAKLDPTIASKIGIGNSTGLGMAPFLLNHPQLLNNWITAREYAIQAVRQIEFAQPAETDLFKELFARNAQLVRIWASQHTLQIAKLNALTADISALDGFISGMDWQGPFPWDAVYKYAEVNLSVEGQEWVASMMLEPYGDLIDGYAHCMCDESGKPVIDGQMTVAEIRQRIAENYPWALSLNWSDPKNIARAWYVSEEKLEPRLGERFNEPIEDYEQPLSPGRDIAALYQALETWDRDEILASFLLRHPKHRHSARRVQIVASAPYSEIRDNTVSDQVLPIDMLRCKLSFFGATKFDPRSDRWVRICMYGDAPLPYELSTKNADFWVYPQLTEGAK